MQILAFKFLSRTQNIEFKNLKVIAFNDSADKGSLELWAEAAKGSAVEVVSKATLFDGYDSLHLQFSTYLPKNKEHALVLHNNGNGLVRISNPKA